MEEASPLAVVHHKETLSNGSATLNAEKNDASGRTLNGSSLFRSNAKYRAESKKHRKYRAILQLIRRQLATVTPRSHCALPSVVATGGAADDADLAESSSRYELVASLKRSAEVDHCEIVELPALKDGPSEVKAAEQRGLQADATEHISLAAGENAQPAPSVYEDPYCAVTADGVLHVSEYYLTSDLFACERLSNHHKVSAKNVRLADVQFVFYADAAHSSDFDLCRKWGLSKNSVWWAADANRNRHENPTYANVVVRSERTSPLQIGFTVVNLTAFTSALRVCGLSEQCHIAAHLPRSANETLQFIDETAEETTGDGEKKENEVKELEVEVTTFNAAADTSVNETKRLQYPL